MVHTIEIKASGTLREIIENLEDVKNFIEEKIGEGEEHLLDGINRQGNYSPAQFNFPMGEESRDTKLIVTTILGKRI